jgi:hypothetical protein
MVSAKRGVLMLIATLIAASPVAAQSQSGEFPGVYVLEGAKPPVTAQDHMALEFKCALAPATMNADGEGAGLVLDREVFRDTGKIVYVRGHDYRCRYDAATRLEHCSSVDHMGGMSNSYEPINGYDVFTAELQAGHTIGTDEELAAWKERGAADPDNRFAYRRCKCLDVAMLTPLISPQVNRMSAGETNWRLFRRLRDPTADEIELGRNVLDALKGCADLKGS